MRTIFHAGDIVKHIPTGETWVLCGVNNERGEVIPCGWPFPTLGKAEDCVLIERGGIKEEYKRVLIREGLESYIEKDGFKNE